MSDEIVVSYAHVNSVMHLYVTQGGETSEMKRRTAVLKLEVATIEAAFKLLDKLGLDAHGTELADLNEDGAEP